MGVKVGLNFINVVTFCLNINKYLYSGWCTQYEYSKISKTVIDIKTLIGKTSLLFMLFKNILPKLKESPKLYNI